MPSFLFLNCPPFAASALDKARRGHKFLIRFPNVCGVSHDFVFARSFSASSSAQAANETNEHDIDRKIERGKNIRDGERESNEM